MPRPVKERMIRDSVFMLNAWRGLPNCEDTAWRTAFMGNLMGVRAWHDAEDVDAACQVVHF